MLAQRAESQFDFLDVDGPGADVAQFRTRQADLDEAPVMRFRDFEIRPRARLLVRAGRQMEIGSRAFDLLVVLVSASGKVVSKDEIVAAVWPTTTVDESNLRFQVASLRRALGRDRDLVKTIPGRGYFFAVDPPEPVHNVLSAAGGAKPERTGADVDHLNSRGEVVRLFFEKASEFLQAFSSVDELVDVLRAAGSPNNQATIARETV